MDKNSRLLKRLFDREPLFLIACSLMLYLLGTGAARYLGQTINWSIFWAGLFWLLLVQFAAVSLNAYYEYILPNRNQAPLPAKEQETRRRDAYSLLAVAATTMTVAALVTISFISSRVLDAQTGFLMALLVVLCFFLVIPPVRLMTRGFGELTIAILVCNVVPVVAYLLQTGDFNRLMAVSTLPLTALFLAMVLALEFEHYAEECKDCYPNMLVRLGWLWGSRFHSAAIVGAYVLLGLAYFIGLPWRITMVVLVTVILAILQLFLLNRIVSGEKPAWKLFNIIAVANFLLAVYLLGYSFWMV
jgi:1,4-dihydroxy-2-naphthoate octaprenyltransferase